MRYGQWTTGGPGLVESVLISVSIGHSGMMKGVLISEICPNTRG